MNETDYSKIKFLFLSKDGREPCNNTRGVSYKNTRGVPCNNTRGVSFKTLEVYLVKH